jgi:N-acetylmuramic acid 6-phosphate etherase
VKRKSPRTATEDLEDLATERPNPASADLDLKSALEIARVMNAEDARVARAVERALPQIARAIDLIAAALRDGGRLIYVGTGTSGRIGALDASEIAPTFGVDPGRVQYVIAGGHKALDTPNESTEDSRELGRVEMARRKPAGHDVVVGVAASGRTPFTIAALEFARRRGAKTVAVTCNCRSPLESTADIAIVTEVGPEVVAGSSRMKAGTAQKMVLNMLSTGAMARLGYVYGNRMVNLHLRNSKLLERGFTTLEQVAGVDRSTARQALQAAHNHVPTALVMLLAGVNRRFAERALRSTQGHVRKAIALAQKSPRSRDTRSCTAPSPPGPR